MRVHIAFYILGMVMAIAAIVCGALGCWKYSTYSLRAAAVCCIAACEYVCQSVCHLTQRVKLTMGLKLIDRKKYKTKPSGTNSHDTYRFQWKSAVLSISK